MTYNKPEVILSGSSIRTIQGQAGETDITKKVSSFQDGPGPLSGNVLATVNAYEADE